MSSIEIVPASVDRFDDVEHALTGGGDGGSCWCQWWMLRNTDFQSATADSEALQPGAKVGEHADLDATAEFTCAKPEQLRRIDLSGLMTRFKRIQRLQAQVVTPQGQFKQTLKRPAQTLTWGR